MTGIYNKTEFKLLLLTFNHYDAVIFHQKKELLQRQLSRFFFESREDLSPIQKQSIYAYKLNSTDYNTLLRDDDFSILKENKSALEVISSISRSIENEQSRIPFELELFRGIPHFVAENIISAPAYIEYGFISTTFDIEEAYDYSKNFHRFNPNQQPPDGYIPLLLILCDPGEKGIYLGEWESEILLNRAIIWTVISDKRYSEIKIIPEDNKKDPIKKLEKVRIITIKRG